MAARNPSSRGRRALQALSAAAFLVAVGGLTAYWLHGQRVLVRAAFGAAGRGGFTTVTPFPLRDSLPALEGGLTNLEAFKATLSPSWKANRDRTIWATDTLGTITLEYLTERAHLDSVTFFLWTGDGPLHTHTVRDERTATWHYSPARAVGTWTEVVAAYLSDPPLLTFTSADSTVELFRQAEGKVMHVVNAWYLNRRPPPLTPDTSYPLDAKYRGEPLQRLARGPALAIVNATDRPVRLRLTGFRTPAPHSVTVGADSGRVAVYRSLLGNRPGTLMAYTDPGVAFSVFRESAPEPPRFFVLARRNP
jgi:hypothetical protein